MCFRMRSSLAECPLRQAPYMEPLRTSFPHRPASTQGWSSHDNDHICARQQHSDTDSFPRVVSVTHGSCTRQSTAHGKFQCMQAQCNWQGEAGIPLRAAVQAVPACTNLLHLLFVVWWRHINRCVPRCQRSCSCYRICTAHANRSASLPDPGEHRARRALEWARQPRGPAGGQANRGTTCAVAMRALLQNFHNRLTIRQLLSCAEFCW